LTSTTDITVGNRGLTEHRHPLETLTPDDHNPVRHLYVHVPFCFHKCHYCDFYSFVDSRDQQGDFTNALVVELRRLSPHAGPLRSVFVGGGTPSLLAVEHWQRVLGTLRDAFDLSALAEFTVECNPETVTRELVRTLAAGGVNRVSVGAQSFDQRHLKTLERWHDPANVERALTLAREAGIKRRSIDLISAIPGQSLDDWRRDLDIVERFVGDGLIEHVSCYTLTYEPNTAMTARMERGDFDPADDETEASFYEETVSRLEAAGLGRYEVSNFAKPGRASEHNLAYWQQHDWLAAGPSGSAQLAGHRWKNVPRLGDWMKSVRANGGLCAIVEHEPPDARRALAERIMMGLRTADGLDLDALRRDADALGVLASFDAQLARQTEFGGVEVRTVDGTARLRLTDSGWLLCDGIAGDLMSAL
jgi:oxygen-independent coproporphyrinogen-3 oxidase